MRIRYKLITGFLLVVLMSGAMGGYAIKGMSELNAITTRMYDHPLMAISFTRSALANFVKLDRILTLAFVVDDKTVIDEQVAAIQELDELVREDLEVVEERALSDDARDLVATIVQLLDESVTLRQWTGEGAAQASRDSDANVQQKTTEFGVIEENLDLLIEMAVEEGYNFKQDAQSAEKLIVNIQIGAVIAVLVIAVAMAMWLGWTISHPIDAIKTAMTSLANGEKTTDIPGTDRTDEIGEMAQAAQVFKDNAIENDRLMAEQEEAEQRAAQERRRGQLKIADNFEASVKGVVDGVGTASAQMQTTAESMSTTAEETSQQAGAVATASGQATANVETVASAAEEMSASIGEIGRQVEQSTQIAQRAVAEAEKTNLTVQGLADAAEKIGAVVELITGIAEQTNLLALNATIEAARAGEAGKGFAVVASEVKSLANQTAQATEEIGQQIASMQSAAGEAVEAIGGIGETITKVNEIAATIAAAVEEQAASTQDIARNVQEAARGTQEVSSNISGVSAGAEETGKAANQVLKAAGQLSQQSEVLHEAVDKFLADIKTA